jgi:isovaleryl-CoA dehydrogenase
MDFTLGEEHRMLREMVRKFSDHELGPRAEAIDREDRIPDEIWGRLGGLGVMGINVPIEYGGGGMDILSSVIVMEELSRNCPAVSLSWLAHSILCVNNIFEHATEEQRRQWLPKLCAGEWIGCMALTEPGAGSDAVGIRTTARQDGDAFLLNGSKTFITNSPIARVALVYTKTRSERGPRGITPFIVDTKTPGFIISRKIEKMGHRGSPTGEITFEDCRVPAANILGEENQGVSVMMKGLDVERTVIAAGPVGLAQAGLDLSIKYALEREQFGQRIARFQMIQAKLADMYTEVEAARLLTYKAAILAQESARGGKGTEIHKVAAAAVLYAAEMAERVALDAIQIHGGYGYTLEYAANRLLRDAKLYTIGAGTSEIRRLVVARELLGM